MVSIDEVLFEATIARQFLLLLVNVECYLLHYNKVYKEDIAFESIICSLVKVNFN